MRVIPQRLCHMPQRTVAYDTVARRRDRFRKPRPGMMAVGAVLKITCQDTRQALQ